MKIVADKNIPYLRGITEQFGEVEYIAGNEFTKEAIKDADTLIVRTVTFFGKELLEGTNVKLICSATIGFDHIDTEYCDTHGIKWYNAPGCNSGSVMQYIISSLFIIARRKSFDLKDKTIGIIGVGNVGKKVARACRILGMRVLLNDPPRQEVEGDNEFVDIDTIKRESDIITFHTPLTKNGKYKTHHLADESFFNSLGKNPLIINSARGGIIKTEAIKDAIRTGKISGTVIDCWENEPGIDQEYMRMTDIATPHIAGYSADGKANATRMSLQNIARFWHLDESAVNDIVVPAIADHLIDMSNISQAEQLEKVILKTYNPENDCKPLLANPSSFSALRGEYPLRREYNAYTVTNVADKLSGLLSNLGFKVE